MMVEGLQVIMRAATMHEDDMQIFFKVIINSMWHAHGIYMYRKGLGFIFSDSDAGKPDSKSSSLHCAASPARCFNVVHPNGK